MSVDVLTLLLTHGSGPVRRPPDLDLSLFLSGIRTASLPASGSVARDGKGFVPFVVEASAFDRICRSFEQAGFGLRPPQIEEAVDTSDRIAWVHLYAAFNEGQWTRSLTLLSSGYKGPDAPALQKLLAQVLDAAGVRDASIRYDLTGE